ncbi:MAG: GntR family transcriptional regulator [Alphaproteobacteria bacterium]|nr:GntR family transcriptional regulator [Alphaproteobacteria bacterium]
MLIRTAPSLTNQVYQAVLDEICDGMLAPGTQLVQEQLADRFGVSRQPIQQAMALLKADGLVEETGRRGMRVVPLDIALMRHHYEIRASLDRLAVRRTAERFACDPALAREAERRSAKVLDAGNRAVCAVKVREQIRHDEAFHALFYEFSGNPLLSRTAEPHWRFLRRVMGEVLRHAAPADAIWREHAGILEAILAGEAAKAEALAVTHIERAADALADALKDRPAEDGTVMQDRSA